MLKKHCFKCEKELTSNQKESYSSLDGHPDHALVFSSNGAYNSEVFNPKLNPDFLRLYICDGCLLTNGQWIHHFVPGVRPILEVKTLNEVLING